MREVGKKEDGVEPVARGEKQKKENKKPRGFT